MRSMSLCSHCMLVMPMRVVQEGRRGFMAGVAQLKAGPTEEQQHHARVLRERLLADLHQQVPPDPPPPGPLPSPTV